MNIGLNPISEEEFNSKVKIKFKNILDGFDKYNYKNLKGNNDYTFKDNEQAFIDFIENVYKYNITESPNNSCYIDFYLKDLSEVDYNNLLKELEFEERVCLNQIKNINKINTEYFEIMDISIVKLLTKMCTRELFFITFYFTQIPLTIWGNYNLNFPMFYEKQEILDIYIDIIQKYKLNIE